MAPGQSDGGFESEYCAFRHRMGAIGYKKNDPETDKCMDWCLKNDISHCNWAVSDKEEEWSIIKPGASATGGWPTVFLTEAGKLARDTIKKSTYYWIPCRKVKNLTFLQIKYILTRLRSMPL